VFNTQLNDALIASYRADNGDLTICNKVIDIAGDLAAGEMNHPAASSGVSQSSFPRRRESRHEELDTRFRGYDKRSKLRGI